MPAGPVLLSPPLDALLPGPTVLFAWTDGGTAATEWWLYLGRSIGTDDLLDSGSLGEVDSLIVDGLPTDGEAIFVRLCSRADGDWQCSDFQYTAALTP